MSASAQAIERRLRQLGMDVPDASAATLAHLITANQLDVVRCARPHPGAKGLNFRDYYVAAFGVDLDGKVPKVKKV